MAHMAHPRTRRRRPVPRHSVHAAVFLLLLIVSRISNVHSVVGWKPWVGHTLLSASGSIMMGWDTLSEQGGIAGIRALLGLL